MTVFLMRPYEPGKFSILSSLEKGQVVVSFPVDLDDITLNVYIETVFGLRGKVQENRIVFPVLNYVNDDGNSCFPVMVMNERENLSKWGF